MVIRRACGRINQGVRVAYVVNSSFIGNLCIRFLAYSQRRDEKIESYSAVGHDGEYNIKPVADIPFAGCGFCYSRHMYAMLDYYCGSGGGNQNFPIPHCMENNRKNVGFCCHVSFGDIYVQKIFTLPLAVECVHSCCYIIVY